MDNGFVHLLILLMRPKATKSPTPTTFYYFIAAVKSYSVVSQCESICSQYKSESEHCDFLLNCTRSSMTDLQDKRRRIWTKYRNDILENQHNESIDTIRYN